MKTLNNYISQSRDYSIANYRLFENSDDIDTRIAQWLIDAQAVYRKPLDTVKGYINPDHTINVHNLREDCDGRCDVTINKRLLDGNQIPDYIIFDGPIDFLSFEFNNMISIDLSDVYKHIPGICSGISLLNCTVTSFEGLPDQADGDAFVVYLNNVKGVRYLKGLDKYECSILQIIDCPNIISLKGGPQLVPVRGMCKINIHLNPNINLNDSGLVEIARDRISDLYLSMDQLSNVNNPRNVFGNVKLDRLHIICGNTYHTIGDCIPWDNTTRVEMIVPNVYRIYTHLDDIFGESLTNVVPKPTKRPSRITALGPRGTRVAIESSED